MSSDPLAECFTRLRNGSKARHEMVEMPYSKMKERVLLVLKEEGFISDVHVVESVDRRKSLVTRLKYERGGRPVLEHIKRVSKPGHRIYTKATGQSKVRGGLGFQILSTSQGVVTDRQAVERKLGGEVIAEIY